MKLNFLHYFILFLFITSLAVIGCKKGEDGGTGREGRSYFRITWSTDREGVFVASDNSSDVPLTEIISGESKTMTLTSDSVTTTYYLKAFISPYAQSAIKDTGYLVTPGTYYIGFNDHSTDISGDLWDGTTLKNKKYLDMNSVIVTENNTGADGEEGKESIPDGSNGDDGADGLDRYYEIDIDTGKYTVTEEERTD